MIYTLTVGLNLQNGEGDLSHRFRDLLQGFAVLVRNAVVPVANREAGIAAQENIERS